MRLIDLDKALKEAEECRMSDVWKVSHEMMNVFKYQPTVKAIPIEWIEKWTEKFYKEINGTRYYMGDGYDTVWDMLEDWKKENADL